MANLLKSSYQVYPLFNAKVGGRYRLTLSEGYWASFKASKPIISHPARTIGYFNIRGLETIQVLNRHFSTHAKHGNHSHHFTEYHPSKYYRPVVPSPHSISEDQAAASALAESMESQTQQTENGKKSNIPSIEDVRRRASSKKNMIKLIADLSRENEDPLIRQAYEELEDEELIKKGFAPLKRPPPGKLRITKKRT